MQVRIVDVVVPRDNVRARRSSGDFADRQGAVFTAEPLHMREARLEPERLYRADPQLTRIVELATDDLARMQHTPLDPRVFHHLEQRRQIPRKRRKPYLAGDGDRLKAVLLPAQKLLSNRGMLRRNVARRHRLAQRDRRLSATSPCTPSPPSA